MSQMLIKKPPYSILILILIACSGCGIRKSINHQPQLNGYNDKIDSVSRLNDTVSVIGGNILKKAANGHWQLFVEGDPLERGLITGSLTKDLFAYQESVFFDKVKELVPSSFKQKLLRGFLKLYNRKLYTHVTEEYKTEIYGLSQYATHKYDDIAPPYLRSLYLHGAHDIGHALQDLAMVGCSSFAAWGDATLDGKLLLGRNFDFYAGDDFAKNKLISFIKPDNGIPFMMVGWPGMLGTVSGMNYNGLTVTINAGKSDIPLVAKTPISLLAREILQYASTLEEAVTIAKKREVFVSEAIMVGSAIDNKAILIEVAPKNFGVYEVVNSDRLICANHFQSDAYIEDENNIKHIKESHSKYRFDRMTGLLGKQEQLTPKQAVAILRDTKGLNEEAIGFGNEKALNQLLAHHGIVFKPADRMVWVSAHPYQLGEFVAYDLNVIFDENFNTDSSFEVVSRNIKPSNFLSSKEYKKYERYRVQDRSLDAVLNGDLQWDDEKLAAYIDMNPDLWSVYFKVGQYYYNKKQYRQALSNFELALSKEVTTIPDVEKLRKYIKKCRRKIK